MNSCENAVISAGLQTDEERQKEAKTLIGAFVGKNPDDETARKILEALE